MNDKSCPFLNDCEHPITKFYFEMFCRKENHVNCRYYCERKRLLKTPIQWLQHVAVRETPQAKVGRFT